MAKATKVSAFMISNGRIFLDAEEAQAHQDELDIKKNLEKFLEDYPLGYLNSSEEEDLIEGMVKHRNELLKILQNA